MIFESHTPPAPFDSLIESVFYYRDFEPEHSIERLVPTGHVSIVIELDGMERHTFDNDTLQPNASFRKAWISGMHRHFISISAHPRSEMFVVQFRATGASAFLHIEMDSIADRVIPGEEILDGSLLTLYQGLLDATSANSKFSAADAWLANRYREDRLTPPDVIETAERLEREPGAKFANAIAPYPGSQKHLITQFRRYLGLTPKYYQRILRFNDILRFLQSDHRPAWAAVAHHCGFTDQSHFIREFRHFSGFSPQQFVDEAFDREVPNFFPLDRRG